MESHHLRVGRTARYHTLGPQDAEDVWFVLHGYGQLAARFLRHFAPLDDGARLVVAPEGLSRFYLRDGGGRMGASWMTKEDREVEIEDYVAYLDALAEEVLGSSAVRTTVLGFSQGTATACRWTVMGEMRPNRLVLWAGGVPPELDLEAARDRWSECELEIVAGAEDEVVTPERMREEAVRLSAQGIGHRSQTFAGAHRIDEETLLRIARSASIP